MRTFVVPAVTLVLVGCSAGPSPDASPQAASPPPAPAASQVVSGAPDTAGSVPGLPDSPYIFRFRQTEPGSSAFNYRDRDLSFYFRPSPTALFFHVQNLQGRPVIIDWDHSQFIDVNERTYKIAHSTTRWRDRYSPLATTQVSPQQDYSDFMFPVDYLMDPGATSDPDAQPHLPLIPLDGSAPTYSGKTFGVDLVFMVEDRPRTYSFRYEVLSVIPR
ncbi:MAG TPA: hypothetical protein VMH61_05615 [Candidatus Acidoferrales bacterium]|nr:hypothetical protein [Candidatus Acidoferrales bacterium]